MQERCGGEGLGGKASLGEAGISPPKCRYSQFWSVRLLGTKDQSWVAWGFYNTFKLVFSCDDKVSDAGILGFLLKEKGGGSASTEFCPCRCSERII